MADYLIQNAAIMDLHTGDIDKRDVLVREGRIAAIREKLSPSGEVDIINAEGKYLSAGWIDAHAHLYTNSKALGLNRDIFLNDGVTYMMDAGSAGPGNFEDYLENCARNKKMPGKAYLNLAYMGIIKDYGELTDLSTVDLKACQQIIEKYPDEIIGVKLRIDSRVCENPWKAMELIDILSQRTQKPVIVHASRSEMPIEDILSFMKKRDIFAHTFASKKPGILDENGNIKPAVLRARERGVFFDLSHGNGNFSFSVAKKAFAQGFLPDAISTDLHTGSKEKVRSLALTMSKMLACGLNLWSVIRLVTVDAAKMLQINDKVTEISVGAPADLTLFQVQEGNYEFSDSDGQHSTGHLLIKPCCVILHDSLYDSRP